MMTRSRIDPSPQSETKTWEDGHTMRLKVAGVVNPAQSIAHFIFTSELGKECAYDIRNRINLSFPIMKTDVFLK